MATPKKKTSRTYIVKSCKIRGCGIYLGKSKGLQSLFVGSLTLFCFFYFAQSCTSFSCSPGMVCHNNPKIAEVRGPHVRLEWGIGWGRQQHLSRLLQAGHVSHVPQRWMENPYWPCQGFHAGCFKMCFTLKTKKKIKFHSWDVSKHSKSSWIITWNIF